MITHLNRQAALQRFAQYRFNAHNAPEFSADDNGRIQIAYRQLSGQPARYIPNVNERSMSIERHPVVFRRTRLNPQIPADLARIEQGQKYSQPSKQQGAPSHLPFFSVEICQAYRQAQPLETLVFTEGEFKSKLACLRGIPTIGFAGISVYRLCDEVEEALRVLQPQNIVIQYDADARSGRFGRRLHFYYSAYGFVQELRASLAALGLSPKIHLCMGNPRQAQKGLDDILLAYPESEAAFRTLQTSDYFVFTPIDEAQTEASFEAFFGIQPNFYRLLRKQKTYRGTQGQYLADVLQAHGIGLSPKSFCNRIWLSPTGSGKTHVILSFAQAHPTLMVCPTRGLCEQVLADAHARRLDAQLYNGDHTNRQAVADRLAQDKPAQFLVCTYQSVASLLKMFEGTPHLRPYHLFVDEAHNFTTASHAEFCLEAMRSVLDNLHKFSSYTLLTGTPIYHFAPQLACLPICRVEIPKARKFVQFADCQNPLASTAEGIRRSLDAGHFPAVLLNNKSHQLETLQAQLAELLPETDFACFNSTTKTDARWQHLLKTSELPDSMNFFVSTSVLKEGVNITDSIPVVDIFVLGREHHTTIEQFANRFRKAEQINVYILRPANRKTSTKRFDPNQFAYQLRHRAQRFCEQLNELPKHLAQHIEKNPLEYGSDFTVWGLDEILLTEHRRFGQMPIRVDWIGHWSVCELQLANYAYQLEAINQNSNDELMLERLADFGFETPQATPVQLAQQLHPAAQASQADKRAARKKRRAEVFAEVVQNLRDQPIPQAYAKRQSEKDTEAAPLYAVFVKIARHAHNDRAAIDALERTQGKAKNIELLLQRLEFAANRPRLAQSHTPLARVHEALARRFQPSPETRQRFTAAELRAAFLECIAEDDTLDYNFYAQTERNDRLLQVLRVAFEVRSERIRREGQKMAVWEIEPLAYVEGIPRPALQLAAEYAALPF